MMNPGGNLSASQTVMGAAVNSGGVIAMTLLLDSNATEMPRKFRVLVVEDNLFLRHGIVNLINQQQDLECCGQADSIAVAPDIAAEQKPDLVLLDLQVKDGETFGLLEFLQIQTPGLPVVMFSQCEELESIERVFRSGARAYVLKDAGGEQVLAAIRAALLGKRFVSSELSERLPQGFLARKFS